MQILFPSFGQEVLDVLNTSNIPYSVDGNAVLFPKHNLKMILVPIDGDTPKADASYETFFLYEDRWRSSRTVTSQRMLSRLGVFRRVHARLCKVVSIKNCKDFGFSPDLFRSKAKKFLDAFHTYGYLKGQEDYLLMYKEDIIAAAQFMKTYQPKSSINPNQDKDSQLKSFEWTRYASLPDVRIAGGMGKVLNQFLSDIDKYSSPNAESTSVKPQVHGMIEVMSYSDNEWSSGDAYRKLGFKLTGNIPPVTYHIDPKTWKRINPRQWAALKTRLTDKNADTYTTIQNQGSRKWVLLIGDGIL
ncbi:MAG: hypothetical protein IJG54_02280 [Bacteroidales bacterium]|nr:hypothetical protein [Bacteroidales bacterium]